MTFCLWGEQERWLPCDSLQEQKPDMSMSAFAMRSYLTRSEWLMLFSGGLGVLHHIDHILRFDHSGWPFRDVVTPFSYSLLVYPFLGVAFGCRRSGWSRFAILLLILLLTQSAHIFLETPIQQYWVWAYNASCTTGATAGLPNLLGLRSPLLGMAAVLLSFVLSGTLIATCISLYSDVRHARATR
ncbi:MAG: hypothetical protein JO170_29175 [Verrucomicrobia bacterium]|nr:hypothetical protein [Verrucomicrobiota bacterium]